MKNKILIATGIIIIITILIFYGFKFSTIDKKDLEKLEETIDWILPTDQQQESCKLQCENKQGMEVVGQSKSRGIVQCNCNNGEMFFRYMNETQT